MRVLVDRVGLPAPSGASRATESRVVAPEGCLVAALGSRLGWLKPGPASSETSLERPPSSHSGPDVFERPPVGPARSFEILAASQPLGLALSTNPASGFPSVAARDKLARLDWCFWSIFPLSRRQWKGPEPIV
jgi:hypothetical protein